MPQQARVTSLEALSAFRAYLIVYLGQARPALEEIGADVLRTRLWIENDQRAHWEGQLRRCTKELEQAQEALFSARLSQLGHETAAQQMAVHRAKRTVEEAQMKLRLVKKWQREFDGRVQPLVKQVEKLHTVFSNDMVQAVTFLTKAINTLAAYSQGGSPASPVAAALQDAVRPESPESATEKGELK
ncbi:MAG TPA: hypothetical protein VG146_19195 [Verrucomicrobiae bacterium]|nr:hypothetical protein [Verrucomicrobiae bacterium]